MEAALVIEVSGRVAHLNPPALKLFGDGRGRPCHDLLKGKDAAGLRVCVSECPMLELAGRGIAPPAFDMEVQTVSARRWVSVSSLCLRASGYGFCIHLLRDIETRHRMEEATRRFLEQIGALTGREMSELLDPSRSPHVALTTREREILDRMVQGLSTRAIGAALHIGVPTVRNHVQNILRKLGVHSRVEAVSRAVRQRLVDAPGGTGR